MKRMVVLVLMCCLFLTGCGNQDDFIHQVAIKNKGLFQKSVDYSEMKKRKVEEVRISDERKLYEKLKIIFKNSRYKKYMHENVLGGQEDFSIDWYAYVEDVLRENGCEVVNYAGQEPDKKQRLSNALEYVEYGRLKNYTMKKVENCLVFVDEQGRYLNDVYYVFLTDDKEIMDKIKGEKMDGIGGLIAAYESVLHSDLLKKEKQWSTDRILALDAQISGIWLTNGYSLNVCKSEIAVVSKKTKWMFDYYADDVWKLESSSHNKWCDFLNYYFYHSDFEEGDYAAYLEVYGEGDSGEGEKGIIREIVLKSRLTSLPSYAQRTVINYLGAMGMSRENAKAVLKKIPTRDMDIDGVKCRVEKERGVYKFYR